MRFRAFRKVEPAKTTKMCLAKESGFLSAKFILWLAAGCRRMRLAQHFQEAPLTDAQDPVAVEAGVFTLDAFFVEAHPSLGEEAPRFVAGSGKPVFDDHLEDRLAAGRQAVYAQRVGVPWVVPDAPQRGAFVKEDGERVIDEHGQRVATA